MKKNDPVIFQSRGIAVYRARYYHGRYECCFWGRRGAEIKEWLRVSFGNSDDMIYASEYYGDEGRTGYDAMVNEGQLCLLMLRWS
jgi:hypothetical protein